MGKSNHLPCALFLMGKGETLVLLLVYVDDILLFSSSDKEIDGVQQKLTEQFKCKSLEEASLKRHYRQWNLSTWRCFMQQKKSFG
ncbi:hypothetical protein CLOM_g1711 [Closterium sp. NIES-68]|nr:hypothetical protein CLOM_g1711 [Closterium sp. NIES-68]